DLSSESSTLGLKLTVTDASVELRGNASAPKVQRRRATYRCGRVVSGVPSTKPSSTRLLALGAGVTFCVTVGAGGGAGDGGSAGGAPATCGSGPGMLSA